MKFTNGVLCSSKDNTLSVGFTTIGIIYTGPVDDCAKLLVDTLASASGGKLDSHVISASGVGDVVKSTTIDLENRSVDSNYTDEVSIRILDAVKTYMVSDSMILRSYGVPGSVLSFHKDHCEFSGDDKHMSDIIRNIMQMPESFEVMDGEDTVFSMSLADGYVNTRYTGAESKNVIASVSGAWWNIVKNVKAG